MSLFEGRKAALDIAVVELRRPTSQDERVALAAAGFVRVDGLPLFDMYGKKQDRLIGERTGADDLGKYDSNGGKIVIVTLSGEIWLASNIDRPAGPDLEPLFRHLAPRGVGAWVPASNGEKFNERHLWRRLANPDWMPGRGDM